MDRYTIRFSPSAIIDVEQATFYYDEQQAGLGKRFASAVLKTLSSVRANPKYSTVRYDNVRCAIVKKFPFLVHYEFDETERFINILAVYSTYKEPLW